MGLHQENKLTPRQKSVVRMVAAGEVNSYIAATLGISEQVVKNHIVTIYDKVGCSNRVQCALWWQRTNDDRDDVIADLRQRLDEASRQLCRWKRRLG